MPSWNFTEGMPDEASYHIVIFVFLSLTWNILFNTNHIHSFAKETENRMIVFPVELSITQRTTTLLFKEQVSFPRNSRRSRRISDDSYYPIGHVRYINIPTWLRGFRVKIVNFLSLFCLPIPKRDLDTKKTQPNIDVCPESLGVMLAWARNSE